jgi:hypothetical protein
MDFGTPRHDNRLLVAALLALGFMVLIGLSIFNAIPEASQRIVDGGIGALGVALGNAIQGLFRSDRVDEQRANNTATALDTIGAAIYAAPPKGAVGIDQEPKQ